MKGQFVISALLLVAAFAIGRMSEPSGKEAAGAGDSSNRNKQALGTKAAERRVEGGRESKSPTPSNWKMIRERANRSREELLDELLTTLRASPGSWTYGSWLNEHLLRTDAEWTVGRIKAEMGRIPDGIMSEWCTIDPERALPFLLAQPAGSDYGFDSRFGAIHFRGMGAKDPEKGLAMIQELPAQRRGGHYASLLGGIAGSNPDQAFGYFERIVKSGDLPDKDLPEALRNLAGAAPAQLVAWMESRETPLPDRAKAELISGLAYSDIEAAKRIYVDIADEEKRNAGFYIATQISRKDPDFGTCVAWIDANAPEKMREDLKGNALSSWAHTFPDQVMDQIRKDPWILGSQRSPEIINLLKGRGEADGLVEMLGTMDADDAAPFREKLVQAGVIEETPDEFASLDGAVLKMAKNPEETIMLWEALDPEKKEKFFLGASNMMQSQPPELLLKLCQGVSDQTTQKIIPQAVARLAIMDPVKAADLVETMPDGPAREAAIKNLHSNWSADDAAAANAWKEKLAGGS